LSHIIANLSTFLSVFDSDSLGYPMRFDFAQARKILRQVRRKLDAGDLRKSGTFYLTVVNFMDGVDVGEDVVEETKLLEGSVDGMEVVQAARLGGDVAGEEAEGRLADFFVENTRVGSEQLPHVVVLDRVPLQERQGDGEVLSVLERATVGCVRERGGGVENEMEVTKDVGVVVELESELVTDDLAKQNKQT
jgi:hypothetical protein